MFFICFSVILGLLIACGFSIYEGSLVVGIMFGILGALLAGLTWMFYSEGRSESQMNEEEKSEDNSGSGGDCGGGSIPDCSGGIPKSWDCDGLDCDCGGADCGGISF